MRAPRWWYTTMVVLVVAYGGLLSCPASTAPGWLRDGVLGSLALLVPVVVLVRAGSAHPERRPWTLPLAVAVCLYLAGHLFTTFSATLGSTATFPSSADVGYLGTYPFLLAALLLALREDLRGARLIVALDGLSGMLAGGAVTCFAIAPLVARAWDGSLSAATTLAYPVCAVVVIAASLGALCLVGLRRGRGFLLWTAGLVVFGSGDIFYAYRRAFGDYEPGRWPDDLWAIGIVMLAVGAAELRPVPRTRSVPGARSLVVVTGSSVCTVVVLAAAPAWSDNSLPTVLCLLTLAVCAVRLMLAFLQLRELAAVREQALTDELTGAANRRALYAALDRRFATPDELEHDGPVDELLGHGFSLALIDLDHFKEVNDSFGHAAGDDLLREVVRRFAAALDQLQTPHLLARLGGDEFAVLLHEVGAREAAMACGTALYESLEEPVLLDEVVLHVRASIGIAVAPEHAECRGDMLFAADAAMYDAKTSAEPVCYYSPSGVGDRRRRLEVAEELYSALERNELSVEYQPIMSADGDLVGAEALVRWDHPERGRLSPAEFLDIAERYRLTPSIASRVLDVSLADLRRWRGNGTIMRLSVNVSASDLHDDSLVDIVASALLKHGVPPSALTVEITETAMMQDPAMAQTVMASLDELGVQLAVDDYGTGYSSLEYLLKLPINEIKLDRAFSAHLVYQVRSVAIVRSTVDLTHALGLRMVAEGVEDEETLAILRDLGCDLVQGWHLGRPMPASGFEAFLATRGSVVPAEPVPEPPPAGPSVGLAS